MACRADSSMGNRVTTGFCYGSLGGGSHGDDGDCIELWREYVIAIFYKKEEEKKAAFHGS